jgi:multiple sugar transport system permease protein
MTVLVVFGIWNSLPFTIILLLSGLQNIDESYYTVAKVDGAKAMRIFRRITVPLLAPTIGLVLTINSISAFKVFTDVTVLFNGSPGPAFNMYTVVYYIYEMMRNRLELGRAAAAAIILFVFIFIFTMLQRYIQRKWNYTT